MKLIRVFGVLTVLFLLSDSLFAQNEKAYSEYKKGKKGLIGLFVGEVKKVSKGKADPKVVTQMLEEKLR